MFDHVIDLHLREKDWKNTQMGETSLHNIVEGFILTQKMFA